MEATDWESQQNFDENPVFKRILAEYGQTYKELTLRQAKDILESGNYTAVLNNIGLNFSNNFSDFIFSASRIVEPAFNSSQFVVSDQLTIEIGASTLFGQLAKDGEISLSEEELASFARLKFRRHYRVQHLADSYLDGLTERPELLFFPFQIFSLQGLDTLRENEYALKEDSIGFSSGAIGSLPLGNGVGASAGAFISFNRVARVEIQVGTENDLKRTLVDSEIGITNEAAFSGSLQAQFLNVLQLTLFRYDFSYSNGRSDKSYFRFEDQFDRERYGKNIAKILAMRSYDREQMSPFLRRREYKKTESKESQFLALLWSGERKAKTEKIEIVEEGVVRKFFRHRFSKIKLRQNLISKMFSALMSAVIHFPTKINNDYLKLFDFSMEYESSENILSSRKEYDVNNGKMSINFKRQFCLADSKRRDLNSKKDNLIDQLVRFSFLEEDVVDMIRKENLYKDLFLDSRFQISRDGLIHFLKEDPRNIHNHFNELCSVQSGNIFKKFRSLFDGCRRKTAKSYDTFYKEWTHRDYQAGDYRWCRMEAFKKFPTSLRKQRFFRDECMSSSAKKDPAELSNVPFWRLKDVLENLVEYARSVSDFKYFYGNDNVFSYGQITGQLDSGSQFKKTYENGIFTGSGAVEDARQGAASRAPASLENW